MKAIQLCQTLAQFETPTLRVNQRTQICRGVSTKKLPDALFPCGWSLWARDYFEPRPFPVYAVPYCTRTHAVYVGYLGKKTGKAWAYTSREGGRWVYTAPAQLAYVARLHLLQQRYFLASEPRPSPFTRSVIASARAECNCVWANHAINEEGLGFKITWGYTLGDSGTYAHFTISSQIHAGFVCV